MKLINKLIAFSNEVFDDQMDVEDTNYEVFSEIMELIFDGVSFQSPEMTRKDVEKTLSNKRKYSTETSIYFVRTLLGLNMILTTMKNQWTAGNLQS